MLILAAYGGLEVLLLILKETDQESGLLVGKLRKLARYQRAGRGLRLSAVTFELSKNLKVFSFEFHFKFVTFSFAKLSSST
jgi:hypothetical protein